MTARVAALVAAFVFLAGAAGAAPGPFMAVGTLFAKDESGSLKMVCTASAVATNDKTTTIRTAAHCISWALQRVEAEGAQTALWSARKYPATSLSEWSKRLFPTKTKEYRQQVDFFVSFDEQQFYGARVLWVGFEDKGVDTAELEIRAGSLPVIPLGSWDDVTSDYAANPGETQVTAISNPLGLGKQAFVGNVSMLSLNRPIVDEAASINWRGNFLASIPLAPGSSGSMVLYRGRVVGTLVGVIQERFGSPFAVAVPIHKIEKAKAAKDYIVPVPPD